LEQKKGDLELIEAENMKILCKNIMHNPCLWWHGPCLQCFKEGQQPERSTLPVPPATRPCANGSFPFAAFASWSSCLFSV